MLGCKNAVIENYENLYQQVSGQPCSSFRKKFVQPTSEKEKQSLQIN